MAIEYTDFSFTSLSTAIAVGHLKNGDIDGQVSGEECLDRYRCALRFLISYQEMELALLDEHLTDSADALPYPPVLDDGA